MTRRGDTPQTPLLQVYANEACTVRPQVGQTYDELWVKVNRRVDHGTDQSWGLPEEPFNCMQLYLPEEGLGQITIYQMFGSDDIEGALDPGVVWCGSGESVEITAPLQVDFYG